MVEESVQLTKVNFTESVALVLNLLMQKNSWDANSELYSYCTSNKHFNEKLTIDF